MVEITKDIFPEKVKPLSILIDMCIVVYQRVKQTLVQDHSNFISSKDIIIEAAHIRMVRHTVYRF